MLWTPRRIALFLIGLFAFSVGYLGYNQIMGAFDGLPPMPVAYRSDPNAPPVQFDPSLSHDIKIFKLEQAFGIGCPETRWNLQIYNRAKDVVFAAQDYEIVKEGPRAGQLKIFSLSVATFGKKQGQENIPEINTFYSDLAFLEFDKPIKTIADFDGANPLRAELHADPESPFPDPTGRKGRILITNNRKSTNLHDDIEIKTPGPVFYEANPKPGQPHVFTETPVQVFDYSNSEQVKPDRNVVREPTVTGVGLKVYLSRDPKEKDDKSKQVVQVPEPKKNLIKTAPKPKSRNDAISGVDLISFDSNVEMNFWSDDQGGFGNDKKADPKKGPVEPKKETVKQGPVEKKRIQIATKGPFRYDLKKEFAHFEKPGVPRPGLVEHVKVTRTGRTSGQDMLDCEFLDIYFQRKKPVAKTPGTVAAKTPATPAKKEGNADSDNSMEIKSIYAKGEQVVIISDTENLHASGTELIHEAEAKMTILKGTSQQPMWAIKDGNLLRGTELHLFGDGKELSQAHILGPGSVGMGDINPVTQQYLKQAFWTERLVYTKTVEQGKPMDVLTFIGKPGGKAQFSDTSSGNLNQIDAHQLKVWLLSPDEKEKEKRAAAKKEAAKDRKDDMTTGVRPYRVEATGDVRSTSTDFIIKQAEYLNTHFVDVPKLLKPPQPKEAKGGPAPKGGPPAKSDLPPMKDGPGVVPKKEAPEPKAEPKQPIILMGKTVEIWVNRDPKNQMELNRVLAKDDVDVHQEPTPGKDQGVDITGKSLDLTAFAEGNLLTVEGEPKDARKMGMVRFDKLTMYGNQIVIDQRVNTAHIDGVGSMTIVSATDLEGKALAKPTTLSIYWNQKMDFRGGDRVIYYHGAVEAYQEFSQVKCEWMQVILDRPVSLNRPDPQTARKEKKDDSPKIDRVVFFHAPKDDAVPKPKEYHPVSVIEKVMEGDRTIRIQSIQAPEIETTNTPAADNKTAHQLDATAEDTMPGLVRIWQAGPKDALGDKPAPKAKDQPVGGKAAGPRADEEMKLTVVLYTTKMKAFDLRKRAIFYGNTRVIHLPTDNPALQVDFREGEIPKGALYLECRRTLEVFGTTQKTIDEKGNPIERTYQEMIATENVHVRKQGEFFGDADKVTYSEQKGLLIFHGTDERPATVNQQRGVGVKNKTYQGAKIIYNVKTKTFESEGGAGLGG